MKKSREDLLDLVLKEQWVEEETDGWLEEEEKGARRHLQEVLEEIKSQGGGQVVLVGDEGEVMCHALLLAATSPLLGSLLKEQKEEAKQVVVMEGWSVHQLQALLQVTYNLT